MKSKWLHQLLIYVCNAATNIFHSDNRWLDRLALFLCGYATVTFFLATYTNTGLPFAWTIFVVYPSIGIYLFFQWLWTRPKNERTGKRK